MTRIKHPAWVTGRGHPSRVSIGEQDHELDGEGYFEIEDETEAVETMDRLADTYGVEYDADGEVVSESTPATPDDSGGDSSGTDQEDAGDTDEGDADDLNDLEEASIEELRERAKSNDAVDTDAIDMRQRDEIVAALMQAESDAFSDPDADDDQQ